MWNVLNKADIAQAKQTLNLRRAETLRRHAEESQNLDADRAEAETLNELVDLFVQKFAKPKMSYVAAPAPVSTEKIGDKASPDAKHQHRPHHQHHQHQTVFATFMRASRV